MPANHICQAEPTNKGISGQKNCRLFVVVFMFLFCLTFLGACGRGGRTGVAEENSAEKGLSSNTSIKQNETGRNASSEGGKGTEGKEDMAATRPPEDPLPYTVKIDISDEKGDASYLAGRMKKLSHLEQLQSQPPDGEFGLELRSRQDVKLARKLMQSEGFYDGTADFTIAREGKRASVKLTLVPGRRYVVGDVTVLYVPAPRVPSRLRARTVELFPAHEIPGIKKGKPVTASDMLARVGRMPEAMRESGYPDARLVEQHYYLDRGQGTLNAAIVINPGTAATLGSVVVSGESDVNSDYISSLAPWESGQELWDSRKVDDYVTTLRRTGLFRNVTPVVLAAGNESDPLKVGAKPVGVRVEDAKLRSIGGTARYDTDTGFGVEGEWEHRNLFHNGEKLSVKLPISMTESGVKAKFVKPEFFTHDQLLTMSGSALREETDAYQRTGITAGAGIERKFLKTEYVFGGVFVDQGMLKENSTSEHGYSIYGMELKGRHDSRDNEMNPTSGAVVELAFKPIAGTYEGDFSALGKKLGLSGYYSPFRHPDGKPDDKLTFAARAEVGSLSGASLRSIPPSQRYYLGGAGSVRGYGYQQIGPMDKEGDPLGALSYQMVNLETRFKVTDTLGFVAFLDEGMAYKDETPDISDEVDWGAGLGVRYYTPIGPVRFDVAMPLKVSDPPVQFYISIGQAF